MKIGVVGYGSIGKRHAANARRLGHKVMVYDPLIGGQNDVRYERNIYETCDAVVVATPTVFHEGPLRACIERGKHVLIEKPISASIGALPDLLRVADEKKLVVMMGNNLHFHPCVQQARAWLDNTTIGTPLWANFICAQFNAKYTDSVLLNWGAHEIDLALHLFGPVSAVLCANVTRDIADCVLLHESGCRSSFHLDYVTPNEIRESWIVGSENNIGIEMLGRSIVLGKWTQGLGGSYDDDYLDEMKCFVDRIDGKTVPGADGWEGLMTLKVIEMIQQKAARQ